MDLDPAIHYFQLFLGDLGDRATNYCYRVQH